MFLPFGAPLPSSVQAVQAPPVTRPPQPDLDKVMHAASGRLKKCPIPIDCSVQVNRNPPPLPWWMPAGSISTNLGWFYAYWHVRQLGDLKRPIVQTITDAQVSQQAHDSVVDAWRATSKALFKKIIATERVPMTGPMAATAPMASTLSMNDFLKAFPDFAYSYRDITVVSVPYAAADLNAANGVRRYAERGGYFLYKPALEGRIPLKTVNLYACAQWCGGCDTGYWQGGVPTCLNQIKIETDNFTWGFYVGRGPGSYVVTINRLPKSIGQRVDDAIDTLTSPLARFSDWMCKNYDSSSSIAVQSAAVTYGGPTMVSASSSFNSILSAGCAPSGQAGVTTGYTPGTTPIPGRGAAAAYEGGNVSTVNATSAPVVVPAGYPARSVAYFDKKTGYHIAVPAAAGNLPYVELSGSQLIAPPGVGIVDKTTYQKLTRPWFKRDSTKLGMAVVGGLAAVGSTAFYLKDHPLR